MYLWCSVAQQCVDTRVEWAQGFLYAIQHVSFDNVVEIQTLWLVYAYMKNVNKLYLYFHMHISAYIMKTM